MSDAVAVVSWKDVVTERAGEGIERQTIHGNQQTMVDTGTLPGPCFQATRTRKSR